MQGTTYRLETFEYEKRLNLAKNCVARTVTLSISIDRGLLTWVVKCGLEQISGEKSFQGFS